MATQGPDAGGSPLAMAIPALDNTFGAMFIGVVVAACLFGVTCVQTFFYFTKYPKDALHLKLLVAAVFCIDLTHQILISHTVYTYVITNFANPAILIEIVWSLVVQVVINGVTALLVQSFYVYRIWNLSDKNYWITGFVALLVVAEFVVINTYSHHAFQLKSLLEIDNVKTESQLINILGAAGDVAIAAAMVYLLHRSRTGFKHSDGVINRLIIFIVNSGLLTSICAICSLISVLAAPKAYIYICFFFCLGRLYTNSLLATLNGRRSTRALANDNEISLSLSSGGGTTRSHTTRGGASTNPNQLFPRFTPAGSYPETKSGKEVVINVERTTEFERDLRENDYKSTGYAERGTAL